MLSTSNFAARIAKGRALEALIVSNLTPQLATIGCKVLEVTADEDIYKKLDRWIVTAKGTRLSLQIKGRVESGDDLIYEVIKNIDTGEEGRDLKCNADLYLFVDRNGKGWMYKLSTIKTAVKTLLEQVRKDLSENPSQTDWDLPKVTLNIRHDNYHGNRKLMAYFSPTYFPVISTFSNLYA